MNMKVVKFMVVVAMVLGANGGVGASFHLWQLSELYSNADGTVQFVELTTVFGGQQFVMGHTITSTTGGTTQSFTLNANLSGDSAGRTFLIGTAAVAALSGVTPDYVVPDGFLFTTNGMLNWAEGADSWSYATLPVDGTHALLRSGGTAINSPRNFAGTTGILTLPVAGDFDGNGKGDLLLRNGSTGQNIGWLMNGTGVSNSAFLPTIADTNWEIRGVGDFDGNGKADVIWRNSSTGQNISWLMNGLTVRLSAVISSGVPLAWQLSGLGDLNHDGKADLVWRHAQSGNVAVWLLNGTAVTSALGASTGVPLSWQIVGVGDVDADGNSDLVWFEAQTVSLSVWLMNGGSVRQAIPVIVNGQPVL